MNQSGTRLTDRDRKESIGQGKEFKFGLKTLPLGEHQLHCENIGDPQYPERTTFLVIGLFTV
jgi:hypothetical protein